MNERMHAAVEVLVEAASSKPLDHGQELIRIREQLEREWGLHS